tara:strand:- start:931 stop:1638 length:708 start_codon:yes stop_codon:yes gene_type:complete
MPVAFMIKNTIYRFIVQFLKIFKKALIPFEIYGISKRFEVDYGYLETAKRKSSVDKNLKPIPWYTYPTIEYLMQLDLRGKKIFEWGGGNSTLYFQDRVKSIKSIESNKNWYEYLKSNISSNCELIFSDKKNYVKQIATKKIKYDIIIIDGILREDCARVAYEYLEDTGFIILDNSDWYPSICKKFVSKYNLIQIDMHGFGPINSYSWTTSIFMNRKFDFEYLNIEQLSSLSSVKK